MVIMKTFTGRRVDLDNFTKDDIDLRDISVSLSAQRRYAGHTTSPWSVGQHLILCSMISSILGMDGRKTLAVFLHDVHETWVQDVISPIKTNFTNFAYTDLSSAIDREVYNFFGVLDLYEDSEFMNYVHAIDVTAYYAEVNRLTMSVEDSHFNFDKSVWEVIKFLEDSNFKIPSDLISMSENDVAQNIFEILNVAHVEKRLGSTISEETNKN